MKNFNKKPKFGTRGGSRFKSSGFQRDRFDNRLQMHEVTCDACKRPCKVPFKPRNNKPVYCNDCFGKQDRQSKNEQPDSNLADQLEELREQVEELNEKIDKIMRSLSID
ncbi:MAG: CxxC-x17-CxxC domain-containing protein [archaeon]